MKMFLKWIICIHWWPVWSQSHYSHDFAKMLQLFLFQSSYHVWVTAVRVEALWVHDQSDTLRHTPFSMSLCDPMNSFKSWRHTHLLFYNVTHPHWPQSSCPRQSSLLLVYMIRLSEWEIDKSNILNCMISHNSSAVCSLNHCQRPFCLSSANVSAVSNKIYCVWGAQHLHFSE